MTLDTTTALTDLHALAAAANEQVAAPRMSDFNRDELATLERWHETIAGAADALDYGEFELECLDALHEWTTRFAYDVMLPRRSQLTPEQVSIMLRLTIATLTAGAVLR